MKVRVVESYKSYDDENDWGYENRRGGNTYEVYNANRSLGYAPDTDAAAWILAKEEKLNGISSRGGYVERSDGAWCDVPLDCFHNDRDDTYSDVLYWLDTEENWEPGDDDY